MHDRQFTEHAAEPRPEIALTTLRDDEDRYQYENMLPLDWSLVLEKYQEKNWDSQKFSKEAGEAAGEQLCCAKGRKLRVHSSNEASSSGPHPK